MIRMINITISDSPKHWGRNDLISQESAIILAKMLAWRIRRSHRIVNWTITWGKPQLNLIKLEGYPSSGAKVIKWALERADLCIERAEAYERERMAYNASKGLHQFTCLEDEFSPVRLIARD